MCGAQEVDQGDTEQPRPQVPQRDVHGGDGHHAQAGAPGVSDGGVHAEPRPAGAHGVGPAHHRDQLALDEPRRGDVGVGVAESNLAAAPGVDDDDGGGIPLQRAVRLRLVGGDLLGGDLLSLQHAAAALVDDSVAKLTVAGDLCSQ